MTATAAPAVGRPAGIALATAVFTVRSLRHALRDVESLLMGVIMPVMMTVLLTFVFGGAISSREQYLQYVVPGIVMLCAGFGAATTAIAVSTDLSTGAIDRFRTNADSGMGSAYRPRRSKSRAQPDLDCDRGHRRRTAWLSRSRWFGGSAWGCRGRSAVDHGYHCDLYSRGALRKDSAGG
nr:ABC transporter permease [Epidermidibacterium keratini]